MCIKDGLRVSAHAEEEPRCLHSNWRLWERTGHSRKAPVVPRTRERRREVGSGLTWVGRQQGPSLGRDRRGGTGKGQKGPVISKQPLSLLLLRPGEAGCRHLCVVPVPEVTSMAE